MTRFFSALVIPAICGAAVAYFGYYTVWGPRGLVALDKVHAQLAVHEDELSALRARHDRLAHRISLLHHGSADPDLVEELANQQLMEGIPGQVAVPRNPRQ